MPVGDDDEEDEVLPVIKKRYFQEIYESKRGQTTLRLAGAELEDEDMLSKAMTTEKAEREAENDEHEFIIEQRFKEKNQLKKKIREPEIEEIDSRAHEDG